MIFTIILYLLAIFGLLCLGFIGTAWSLDLRDKRRKDAKRRRAMKLAAQVRRDPAPGILLSGPAVASRPVGQASRTRVRPPSAQRKPANPNLPRVTCSQCRKQITLTNAGTLRSHGGTPTGMGYIRNPCRGSGKKYVDYVIHEEPI